LGISEQIEYLGTFPTRAKLLEFCTQSDVVPGYGLTCNPEDPASIATALRWYLEHPIQRREMGDRGRQKILDEWHYETQFQKVKNKVQLC
jgi:glycosyltransferase involved in cell wall biosynthesis